jgi:putative DNA primase/helicase
VIRGTDDGIWRRLMLFYFRVQFDDAVKDTTLGAQLEAERAGILALLVREAQAYLREGLLIPESMRRAINSYRQESDLFGEFIAESCTVGPAGEVPFANLYGVYQNHCERNGTKAASSKWLSRKMQERGFSTVSKRVEGKVCKVVVGLSFA